MADDLERTAKGIAKDEKADQQNDNSRQHKMALEKKRDEIKATLVTN